MKLSEQEYREVENLIRNYNKRIDRLDSKGADASSIIEKAELCGAMKVVRILGINEDNGGE